MIIPKVVLLSVLSTASWCAGEETFPPWFKFGTASSSYQVEGAWNVSDKSENLWDRFTHTNPRAILDVSNGDEAADSYHQWKRDVEMVSELGVNYYRFSISWSRLLPNGFSNYISEDGKNYYNNLINGLLEKGIEPFITLFHWDMPQSLQDLGGWTNPLISDIFSEYARVVYSLFGDRVKTWLTINEPFVICDLSYKTGWAAPGILDLDVSPFLCIKHMLIGHAKAWRIYDEEFKLKYHGKTSFANHFLWIEPSSNKDEELANLAMQYANGLYFHPVYSKAGGWPVALEKYMENYSTKEGYPRSKLPPFSEEEIRLIKGTYDFLGINYYTNRIVRSPKSDENVSTFSLDGIPELNAVFEKSSNWTDGFSLISSIYPEGLRKSVTWLKNNYEVAEVVITENGFSSSGALDDDDRSAYIRNHLAQVLLSIKEDGVNITGYTYWSLMDCFEWIDGYATTLGLYKVDFTSPQRTRTPRRSAHYYKNVIQRHSLPDQNETSAFTSLS